MTDEELKQLREPGGLCDALATGPWKGCTEIDEALMRKARDAVPKLLDEIEALRDTCGRIHTAVADHMGQPGEESLVDAVGNVVTALADSEDEAAWLHSQLVEANVDLRRRNEECGGTW